MTEDMSAFEIFHILHMFSHQFDKARPLPPSLSNTIPSLTFTAIPIVHEYIMSKLTPVAHDDCLSCLILPNKTECWGNYSNLCIASFRSGRLKFFGLNARNQLQHMKTFFAETGYVKMINQPCGREGLVICLSVDDTVYVMSLRRGRILSTRTDCTAKEMHIDQEIFAGMNVANSNPIEERYAILLPVSFENHRKIYLKIRFPEKIENHQVYLTKQYVYPRNIYWDTSPRPSQCHTRFDGNTTILFMHQNSGEIHYSLKDCTRFRNQRHAVYLDMYFNSLRPKGPEEHLELTVRHSSIESCAISKNRHYMYLSILTSLSKLEFFNELYKFANGRGLIIPNSDTICRNSCDFNLCHHDGYQAFVLISIDLKSLCKGCFEESEIARIHTYQYMLKCGRNSSRIYVRERPSDYYVRGEVETIITDQLIYISLFGRTIMFLFPDFDMLGRVSTIRENEIGDCLTATTTDSFAYSLTIASDDSYIMGIEKGNLGLAPVWNTFLPSCLRMCPGYDVQSREEQFQISYRALDKVEFVNIPVSKRHSHTIQASFRHYPKTM